MKTPAAPSEPSLAASRRAAGWRGRDGLAWGLLLLSAWQYCQAYPCLDVASSQQCWADYASNGQDPGFASAWTDLTGRAADGDGPPDLLQLALAQLGYLRSDFGSVITHAGNAAHLCLVSGHTACELQARRFLSFALDSQERYSEAIWEAEKSYELSRLLALPSDQVKAASALARHRLFGLNNIPRALQVLEQSAGLVEAVDPVTRLFFGHWRARAALRLGHQEQALLALESVAANAPGTIVEGLGDASRVDALALQIRAAESPTQRDRLLARLIELRNDPAIEKPVQLRAALARQTLAPNDRVIEDLLWCAETARELGVDDLRSQCETRLVIMLAASDPEAADRWLAISRDSLKRSGTPEMALLTAQAELRLLWARSITDKTVSRSLELLSAIERGRSLQRIGERASELLGFLNNDHYWLADRILEAVQSSALATRYQRTALAILEAARSGRQAIELEAAADMVALRDWLTWREQLERSPPRQALSRDAFDSAEQAPRTGTGAAPTETWPPLPAELPADRTAVFFQWHHDLAFVRRAFVIHAGQVSSVALDPQRRADGQLALLDSGVRSGNQARIAAALAELAEILIAPLAPALARTRGPLVLLPDGELNAVPLTALDDGNRRLENASSYRSLKAWTRAGASLSGELPRGGLTPLIFANPQPPSAPLPGTRRPPTLPRLPATLSEAQAIADDWPGSRVVAGAAASETAAVAALTGNPAWLHFATHVKIQPDEPLNSSLQLAPDRLQDGWLTVRELSDLTLPPKVVVLSACESASGRRLTGEGLIGLTSTLLDAGAVTVAANLWPIDDALASTFVRRWYGRLGAGQTLGAALASTRREFAEAGYPASAWAGWIITGDSSVRLPAVRRGAGMLLPLAGGIMAAALAFLATHLFLRARARQRHHDTR